MRNVGRIVYLTSRASSHKGANPLIEHTHHIKSKRKIEFNMCYTLKLTKEEQWRKVPWNKFDKQIRKIQERIYDASVRNDSKSVRTLQKVLIELTSAKFIAVQRVSHDNQRKRTARVNRTASLTPTHLIDLVNEIKIDGKVDPIRKIYILKPNGRQRPMGSLTMRDRAKQFLLLMALEPEWEAKFEPNSYGFRPGRSCQDARVAICQSLEQKAKYVFTVSIDIYSPTIAHNPLLDKLNTIPRFRKQIRSWLKERSLFEGVTRRNTVETPHGRPISILLANVALHGLEKHVVNCLETWSKNSKLSNESVASNGLVVRYVNDFVILYPDLNILEKIVIEVKKWLLPLGLKISKHKSSIRHTLYKHNGSHSGFKFLGFYFSHKQCGVRKITRVTHTSQRAPIRYYLSQKPDRDRIQKHIDEVRDIVKRMEKCPQEKLLTTLNPIIESWTNYYAYTDNVNTFHYCDKHMFYRLMRYACNRHKSKGKKWIIKKYFHTFKGHKWFFVTPDRSLYLRLYSKRVNRNKYIKVTKGKSPYDGDTRYWNNRWKASASPTQCILHNLQNGKCAWCKNPIFFGQVIETDYILHKKDGKSNSIKNLRIVHGHCHDQIPI